MKAQESRRTLSALLPLSVTTGGAGGGVAAGVAAAAVGGTVAAAVGGAVVAVAVAPGKTVLPEPGKARASGAMRMAIIARMATTVAPVSRRFIQPLHLTWDETRPAQSSPAN